MLSKMSAALKRMQQLREDGCVLTSEALLDQVLPKRNPNAHKGDFGRVLIVAGSVGYTGAPVLAANAALRSGAGLIFTGVPEAVYPIVAQKLDEPMVFPLPCDEDGRLNTDIYYNDCFITDFQLYNTDSRLRHLTELLATARTPEAHPLLTAYEFSRWRETVLEAYRGACKDGNPVRFIDEAYVRAFAGDAIPLIDRVFEALRAPEGD